MKPRVALVGIGQSPREDLVPELLAEAGVAVDAREFGALDGMAAAEIDALGDGLQGYRLVSRLASGREVLLPRDWVARRLQQLLDRLDEEGFDLILLLCTGSFPELHSRTLLLEAGRLVDGMVAALAEGGRRVGILVPEAGQAANWRQRELGGVPCLASHASPYTDRRFAAAAGEVAAADLIVMHCMGYDRAMRREVARHSGRPVLLSRGVVAGALRELA